VAGSRSAQTTVAVATIAADLRAPSHLLTVARAATRTDGRSARIAERQTAELAAGPQPAPEFPGPVERILHDLGVTSPAMLMRAAAIDHLGEQLILDATQDAEPEQASLEAIGLSRSTGPAELINHVLATGNPQAAAILRPPIPPAPRAAGRVSDRTGVDPEDVGHEGACRAPEAEAEP
jgi:hypothetical protein